MFCPLPFTTATIVASGDVYACLCPWPMVVIGNVLRDNLMTIWKGEAATQFRNSILDGSFRHCSRCPYLPGPRWFVKSRNEGVDIIPERIGMLKLDYDQSCNLACGSCRKTHSVHWCDLDKAEAVHQAVLVSGALEHTDSLYISGAGDPIASRLYWDFLRRLPHLTTTNRPKVILHTNGQLLNEAHWADLGATQDDISEIRISIDAATPETYALNRGSSWGRLISCLNFVARTAPSHNLKLILFFVAQANNFEEMPRFVKLANNFGAERIEFTTLQNWGTYTPLEYQSRAVHLSGHPLHKRFMEVVHLARQGAGPVVKWFDV